MPETLQYSAPEERKGVVPKGWIAVLLFVGALIGAGATIAIAFYRPAASFSFFFALFILLGATLIVGSRSFVIPDVSRLTRIVILVAIAAIVSFPLLGAFGIASPIVDMVGIVGAVAALATLALVQRQIGIAERQLRLAEREIDLVAQDLEYSRSQSEFTARQVAELARKPRLTLTFPGGATFKVLGSARGKWMLSVDLVITNSGDRTSRDCYIEILIPWQVMSQVPEQSALEGRADNIVVDDVSHRKYTRQVDAPIYRDLPRPIDICSDVLALNPPPFTLLWRIRDDFGAYPEDAQWGRLDVRVQEKRPQAGLCFGPRSPYDVGPMLAWDRTGPDKFVFANLTPDDDGDVVIIDASLQRRIEELVWSMPGLAGTKPENGEIGITFTLGDHHGPLSGVMVDELRAEEVYERGRHRCFVRSDGGAQVRLPMDDNNSLYQIVRALGATYALVFALHRVLQIGTHAKGKFSFRLMGLPDNIIRGEGEKWLDMDIEHDVFVDYVTTLISPLQRAGQSAPDIESTRDTIRKLWKPYVDIIEAFSSESEA